MNEILHLLPSTKSWHYYTTEASSLQYLRYVMSLFRTWILAEKRWKLFWWFSELEYVLSTLWASYVLDARHKPVLCVFHTNFVGGIAVTQNMSSTVHLNHWYLSSQTSLHHTSNENNVKHLNYFIQKLLRVLMCTTYSLFFETQFVLWLHYE